MSEAPGHLLFEVISGKALGSTITVEDELVIGRHVSGPGRLSDDEEISRQHARISREATGDYAIEDLGSSNGTFVNGLRIQSPRLLSPGDSIETGATTLVVREIERPAPAASVAPAAGTPSPSPTAAPDPADTSAPTARAAQTSARSTITPPQTASPPPRDASPDPEERTGPTPPLKLRLDVDFDAREAQITLGSGGETVRMVLEDGDWRAVSTGLEAED